MKQKNENIQAIKATWVIPISCPFLMLRITVLEKARCIYQLLVYLFISPFLHKPRTYFDIFFGHKKGTLTQHELVIRAKLHWIFKTTFWSKAVQATNQHKIVLSLGTHQDVPQVDMQNRNAYDAYCLLQSRKQLVVVHLPLCDK